MPYGASSQLAEGGKKEGKEGERGRRAEGRKGRRESGEEEKQGRERAWSLPALTMNPTADPRIVWSLLVT